jgi:hypothetical protein
MMFRFIASKPLDLLKMMSTLRTKALRTGVWFTSLSHEDRMLASMINRHIKIVKNATLATVMARIICKILHAIKTSSFLTRIEAIGRPMARAYSGKAYAMGNKNAPNWAEDTRYIRYLGQMAYHNNRGYYNSTSVSGILTQTAGAAQ